MRDDAYKIDDIGVALLGCIHQRGVAPVVLRIHVDVPRGEELDDGGVAVLGCPPAGDLRRRRAAGTLVPPFFRGVVRGYKCPRR